MLLDQIWFVQTFHPAAAKWHWTNTVMADSVGAILIGTLKAIFCLHVHVYTQLKKGCLLNCCIVHCALLHTQTAMHHGCNEFVHCCMTRLQSIVVHIASMANTRMSLSHCRYLQCYLKIRYIHGALRSGYATMRNATIQKTTFF